MTAPIKSSPLRLYIDPAEIFAQKTQVIIKIKQVMLTSNINDKEASQMLSLEEKEFKEIIAGEYTNYPLAYLRTLHR